MSSLVGSSTFTNCCLTIKYDELQWNVRLRNPNEEFPLVDTYAHSAAHLKIMFVGSGDSASAEFRLPS